MKTSLISKVLICLAIFTTTSVNGTVYHVSVTGNDKNPGTESKPLKTIQSAANLAQPGDIIQVHKGSYREQVNPPRGGTSESARIIYEAAPGEEVMIKGSEIVKGWKNISGDQLEVTLNNEKTFGKFNPYNDSIWGDWCSNVENQCTGMLYIDGVQMVQAKDKSEYEKPGKTPYFIAEVNEKETILRGWFVGVDPNKATIEINVRQSCFFPTKEGINYLTIRGFKFSQAATPWAPPSARQIAMITAHWCKGWIIEHNTISDSRNCGIALGKFGDEFDNTNTQKQLPGVEYHNKVVLRALAYGWTKEKIGHHIVRYNHISRCAQAGIIGAHGGAFSTITHNTIFNCANEGGRWQGAEKAGIKLHMAVDAVISYNHIYNCAGSGGLWLDWLMQGTMVKGNLFHDNKTDFFLEVSHGPTAVYNNFFLSGDVGIKDWSHGAAYSHNLITGNFVNNTQGRKTPYFSPHSLNDYKIGNIPDGEDRFYNNMLVNSNMSVYDNRNPMWIEGNVLVGKSIASLHEPNAIVDTLFNPNIKITEEADGWYLEMSVDHSWNSSRTRPLISTSQLPKAQHMGQAFENADGTPYAIDTDYFGNKRNLNNPSPGPIELKGTGIQRVKYKVWPVEEEN